MVGNVSIEGWGNHMKNKIHEIEKLVEGKERKFFEISDKIWAVPELFFQEYKSAAILIRALKDEGFNVDEGIAGLPTAFVATWGSGKPTIGVLGEFDALPLLSQKASCSVRAELVSGGPGHGCGHNVLGAGSLAAVVAAKDYLQANKMGGTLRYYGCPGEEAGWGKMFMARDGYFDDLDACYTWHPGQENTVIGMSTLANLCAYFHFSGKTSHAAAAPHLGRSALDACEIMSVGVNYLREHIIPEARVHYAYQDVGGSAPNVVQDRACVKYYIRAPKIKQAKEIGERVKEIARGAALITGTQVKIEFVAGMCDYVPNDVLSGILSDALLKIGGPRFDADDHALAQRFFQDFTHEEIEASLKELSHTHSDWLRYDQVALIEDVAPYVKSDGCGWGSTDVGDVSYAVPLAQMTATCWAKGTPGHSWKITAQSGSSIAHKAISCVAKVIGLAIIETIENPDKVAAALDEHVKTTGGKYVCPVGPDVKPRFTY